jgi:hypothetical protein
VSPALVLASAGRSPVNPARASTCSGIIGQRGRI